MVRGLRQAHQRGRHNLNLYGFRSAADIDLRPALISLPL